MTVIEPHGTARPGLVEQRSPQQHGPQQHGPQQLSRERHPADQPSADQPSADRHWVWSGDVTWREVPGHREALFDLLESPGLTRLYLDVREVRTIDTPGVAVLIGANHRAAASGRRLVLVDANGPVTAALSRMRMLAHFLVTQVPAVGCPAAR